MRLVARFRMSVQHRARMPRLTSMQRAIPALSLLLALAVPASALAQLGPQQSPPPAGDEEEHAISTALQEPMVWTSGAPDQLWLITGLTIAGAALIFGSAAIVWEFGRRDERYALDPATTQLRAQQLTQSANDLMTATNVLLIVGSAAALCGITWAIALPFSSRQIPAPRATLSPFGFSIEGSF